MMGKKEKFISIFRKDKEEGPGHDRLVSLTLVSGKVVKDTELATTSKKMNDKKVIRNSQMHLQGGNQA